MTQANKGDTVRVHFTGRLEDGTEFGKTKEDEPLEFTIGQGQVIPGFEQSTVGMEPGEKKTVELEPDQAFGEKRPELISKVERSVVPEHIDLNLGSQLQVTSADGNPVQVTVTELTDEHVTLDANPPLAGLPLTFDIELVEVV
ncbi:MAG: FKBP-type peptidyl-prolyl cis-trans isomerase [Thermodesulfobacteriota bacterium]